MQSRQGSVTHQTEAGARRGMLSGGLRGASFRLLQVCLATLTLGLVFLVALGSGRSLMSLTPAQRLLDIRPVVGDLLILLAAMLAAEVGVLVYVLAPGLRRGLRAREGNIRDSSNSWARLVAPLIPFVLLAVVVAFLARSEDSGVITPVTLAPPVALPIEGGTGPGSPLVVHWWYLGGLALVVAASVLAAVLIRRRRDGRLIVDPAISSEKDDLRAAVAASFRAIEYGADPRQTVISAYEALERVLSQHGLPRKSWETPLEYLARWTGVIQVSEAAAKRLAALYERARFSPHLVDEDMRREAQAALCALRAEIGKPVAT